MHAELIKAEAVAADHRANFAAERGRCDALIAELLKATADLDGREGILTGQRRGEVAGMTLGEISDDFAIWTLPGERTKNGAAHPSPSAHRRAIFSGH